MFQLAKIEPMLWDCSECAEKKKEIENNEEFMQYIRDELKTIVSHLSERSEHFDYTKVNGKLASLCREIGIEFNSLTVTRSQAFRIKRGAL